MTKEKELTISDLKARNIETKFGLKEKWSIRFAEKPDLWVDVWQGNWCKNWVIGARVKIEDDQWQSREYQGKPYWTIRAPEGARGGVSWNEFSALKVRVEAVEASLIKKSEIPIIEGDPIPEDLSWAQKTEDYYPPAVY